MSLRTIYTVPKSRAGTFRVLNAISRMRLSIINDYVPLRRRPFVGINWYRLCDVSFGKRNMGGYIVYAQIILFSYGFQLWRRA